MSDLPQTDVVLVQAPFFRLVGSHNDRMPLSLTYMSAYLKKAGIDHAVFNPEFTGAKTYWRWQRLLDHFDVFKAAVDGISPVFYEVAETVMDMKPKVVILNCADALLASVCLGNPFAAEQMAKIFKKAGVQHVYASGQYATLDADRWSASPHYDGVLIGEPSQSIIGVVQDALEGQPRKGKIPMGQMDMSVMPNLDDLYPRGQKTDIVMTSVGCSWTCSFCLTPRVTPKFRYFDPAMVAQDIERRESEKVYFGDMIFPVTKKHVEEVAAALRERHVKKGFTCEARVDTLDPERCAMMKEMGMDACKVGIESVDEEHLKGLNKKSNIEKIEKSFELVRGAGMKFVAYAMLGGPGSSNRSTELTYEWLKAHSPDYVVVSIHADDAVGTQAAESRYDTHFSPVCLAKWGIDEAWFGKYLGLQKDRSASKIASVIG